MHKKLIIPKTEGSLLMKSKSKLFGLLFAICSSIAILVMVNSVQAQYLVDDFSGSWIEETKWEDLEFVRYVQNGVYSHLRMNYNQRS